MLWLGCECPPQSRVGTLGSPLVGAALEGCGTFERWILAGGTESLGADLEVFSLATHSVHILLPDCNVTSPVGFLSLCLPCHDGLYPLNI